MKKNFILLITSLLFVFASNTSFAQWATSGTNIYNTNTGNVGIGTGSGPAYPLTIFGSGRVLSVGDDQGANTNVLAIFGAGRAQFGYNGANQNAVIQGAIDKGIEFNVNNATFGSGQAMVIRSSGKVGIGTSVPKSLFDVFGGISVGSYAGVTAAPANGLIVSGSMGVGTSAPLSSLDVAGGAAIGSYAGTTAAPANSLIISGSLGIGTSSPSNQLTLSGTSGRVAVFGADQPETVPVYAAFAASRTFIGFNNVTSNALFQGGSSRGIEFNVNSSTFGSGHAMVISSDAKVGIGTTTPLSLLDVDGGAAIGSYAGTAAAPANGLIVSGKIGIGTATPSYQITTEGLGSGGRAASFGNDLGANDKIYAGFAGPRGQFGYDGDNQNAVVQGGDDKGIEFNVNTNTFGSGTAMVIKNNRKVGIGTINPDEALTVAGTVHSSEVLVNTSIPTPDYVFNTDYQLPSLTEVKAYINANHHLQDMPSAAEVDKNGLKLGQMNMALLKKVEELTLYALEKDHDTKKQQELIAVQEDRLSSQEQKLSTQQNQLTAQQAQIDELKSQLQQLIKSTSLKQEIKN